MAIQHTLHLLMMFKHRVRAAHGMTLSLCKPHKPHCRACLLGCIQEGPIAVLTGAHVGRATHTSVTGEVGCAGLWRSGMRRPRRSARASWSTSTRPGASSAAWSTPVKSLQVDLEKTQFALEVKKGASQTDRCCLCGLYVCNQVPRNISSGTPITRRSNWQQHPSCRIAQLQPAEQFDAKSRSSDPTVEQHASAGA